MSHDLSEQTRILFNIPMRDFWDPVQISSVFNALANILFNFRFVIVVIPACSISMLISKIINQIAILRKRFCVYRRSFEVIWIDCCRIRSESGSFIRFCFVYFIKNIHEHDEDQFMLEF